MAGLGWQPVTTFRCLISQTQGWPRPSKPARTGEQGRKLGELVLVGELRERNAAMAIAKAKEDDQPDYVAAKNCCESEPAVIRPKPLHLSLIRSWDYEVVTDGVCSGTGGVRKPRNQCASCAGRDASDGSVQNAKGYSPVLGCSRSQKVRFARSKGEGAAC